MPCTPVTLPGGVRAIVCHRTRRPRCACGAPATLQCDAPAQRKSGTCDRYICPACATEVGPDRHLCQQHRDAQAAPVQQEIFP